MSSASTPRRRTRSPCEAGVTDADRTAGTIVVSGTGRVAVDPDVAELRLGVSISRPTVDAARAAAAEAMAAILAAVTDAGVARRDVRTTLLSVQPRYDYRDGKPPTLTGYDLANVVERHGPRPRDPRRRRRRRAERRCDEPRWPDVPGERPERARACGTDRRRRRGPRSCRGPGERRRGHDRGRRGHRRGRRAAGVAAAARPPG